MLGLFGKIITKEEEGAKANDTEKESVCVKKAIMVGLFTHSGFLVHKRGEKGCHSLNIILIHYLNLYLNLLVSPGIIQAVR